MSYLVLARKWRPLTFDDMVGQEFIARTLKNAVRTGRLAHAFLFTGSRGVGKTSAARILAKCLNCDQGPTPTPCNECASCREITEGRSLEVYEIDGASNTSVDDIRELRENIKYMPRPGKRRVYIIDEVHMLSKSAFNALLKTLEEPPEHVVFIFATTEPHKVPETIQSRCQRFDFRRIPRADILERLREMARAEGLQVGDAGLSAIAKAADGSMRDAQSLLDQVISYCGTTVPDEAVTEILGMAGREHFFRISEAVLAQRPDECLEALDEVHRSGHDITQFYRDFVEHFRNLLVCRLLPQPGKVLQIAEGEIQDLQRQAQQAEPEDLRRLVSILLKAEEDILRSDFPRLGLEVTLIKMAELRRLEPLEEILERLEAIGPAEPRGGPGSGRPRRGGPRSSVPPPHTTPRSPIPSGSEETSARGSRASGAPLGTGGPGAREKTGPVPGVSPEPPPLPRDVTEAREIFLQAVRREKGGTAALLEDVARWEFEGGTLKAFCEPDTFLYQRLRDPAMNSLLTSLAAACFGEGARFQLHPLEEKGEEKGSLPAGTAGERTIAGTDGTGKVEEGGAPPEVVQVAVELFHGRVLDVKKPEVDPSQAENTEGPTGAG